MIMKIEPCLCRSVLHYFELLYPNNSAPILHVHRFIAQSVKMLVEQYDCDLFLFIFKYFLICNIIIHVSLLFYRVI